MNPIIFLSILFCVIAMPTLANLTGADLDKIRLIVKKEITAEITKTNDKIDKLDARFRNVETDLSWIKGKMKGKAEVDGTALGIITVFTAGVAVILALVAILVIS